MTRSTVLDGPRFVLDHASEAYPRQLLESKNPPDKIYGIGDPAALVPGLAVVGARNATPYGRGCARRFARIAAEKGIIVVSGGALGCDSEAHRAALEGGGMTVVVFGGGCDNVYPARHSSLFQRAIDAGGAVISEHEWAVPPLPYMFRGRNRIIAGLSRAVLIVEAGLPSGTFSTADDALDAGREVLVVPGAITSASSRGSNRLLYQGASPIVDDESFEDACFRLFGMLKHPPSASCGKGGDVNPIIAAIQAEPLTYDAVYSLAIAEYGSANAEAELMELLVQAEADKLIARHRDGKWGALVRSA